MIRLYFKGLFVTTVFMLLGCLSIDAADDDLTTQQITITLEKAGTLPDRIEDANKYKITNLKIVGEINGTDLRLIRDMAGRDSEGASTDGKLSTLDLSETKIVRGGDYYIHCDFLDYYTEDNKLGDFTFFDCRCLTNLVIPSGVTSIGGNAFEGCSSLTSVSIPSSVISIDADAFSGCSGLTSLVIPSSITSIDWSTFSGCSGLTSLEIPSSVTSIGWYAFYGCSSLTSLEIPSSVTSIDGYAFKNCSGLTSIYVSWMTPLSIYAKVFHNVNKSKCILHVPQGTYHDYSLAEGWGDFENIVEYAPTGIDNTTSSTGTKEVYRYSTNGQQLFSPTKGVNIVKYSDGSVRKVAVQ